MGDGIDGGGGGGIDGATQRRISTERVDSSRRGPVSSAIRDIRILHCCGTSPGSDPRQFQNLRSGLRDELTGNEDIFIWDQPTDPFSSIFIDLPEIPWGVYLHYKGGFYDAEDLCWDVDREIWRVRYTSLDYKRPGTRKSLRPYEDFFSNVEVNGVTTPRFRKVD